MRRKGKLSQKTDISGQELRSDCMNVMENGKECYLCGGTEFNKRPGSLRDDPDLSVCECVSLIHHQKK